MTDRAVTLIRGGEGNRPLSAAVKRLLARLGVAIEWHEPDIGPLGEEGWDEGTWERVAQEVNATGIALCCPLGLPKGATQRSPHVQLRERCECFAGLRQIRSIRGLKARVDNLDLVIVRETTEDVYAGHEHEVMPGGVATLKVVTENACDRIAHFAFSYARRHGRKTVSVIHKANIMKLTDGLFLRTARRVAKAYPEVVCEDLIVDNASMQMVLRPERYDVILCGNLYGDILSAIAAGLVGGIAAMPGTAIAKRAVIFECLNPWPASGETADHQNPLKLILPAMHLLHYVGEDELASRIWSATEAVLMTGQIVTPDLGGSATTDEMTDAILGEVEAAESQTGGAGQDPPSR